MREENHGAPSRKRHTCQQGDAAEVETVEFLDDGRLT